jgi:protein phosphatase
VLKVSAASLSDIGNVRAENQDRCLCEEARLVFGVADGVSGLPFGAAAAQAAVDAVRAAFEPLPPGAEPDPAAIVAAAHRAVAEKGRELGASGGIGTTLTWGQFGDGRLAIAHVGDSRCYVCRAGIVSCLTEDHSVANEVRRTGSRAGYGFVNPRALVRCLGQPIPLVPDLIRRPVSAGERYLFCTDGITEMLNQRELARLLAAPGPPEQVLGGIVDAALRRGGLDNASGVLVRMDEA